MPIQGKRNKPHEIGYNGGISEIGGFIMKKVTTVTTASLELRRRGMSVRALAEVLERSANSLYPVVGRRRRATNPERVAIAEFLGIPVAELFDDEGFARVARVAANV